MTCFITAWVTVLSRVSDYHHRFTDIIAGSLLGIVIALFITLQTGRVLFEYGRIRPITEIDQRAENSNSGKGGMAKRKFVYT